MISEEEANAQLERLQQRLTLNLQEIDKNFTECNQILTSKIIPQVEQYAESTSRIWNHSKIWLYFFNSLNEINDSSSVHQVIEEGTNRPPHDLTIDSAGKWQQPIQHDVTMKDITTFNRARMSFQPATSTTSQESSHRYQPALSDYSGYDRKKIANPPLIKSVSTDSTSPSSHTGEYRRSPPRSIPFAPSPKSLIGTPIREQARILTDNLLHTAGIRSSDDETEDEALPNKKRKTKGKERWDSGNMMEVDDDESRNKFNHFFQERQARYQDISQLDELPTLRQSIHSPSSRYDRHESPLLASTPTMQRVLSQAHDDLRKVEIESPTFMHLTPLNEEQKRYKEAHRVDTVTAYEFTTELTTHSRPKSQSSSYNQTRSSMSSSIEGGAGDEVTIRSNISSIIPAKFAIHYFPERFRTPPASTQLTRIYQLFADRPGAMITLNEVIQDLNDPECTKENLKILIPLLVRKKFLKKIGDKDAWTVRR